MKQPPRPVAALVLALATGCASYTPAPVASDALLPRYNARSLEDPGLRAWFDSLGVAPPATAWNRRELAIAATWLRADRAVRRAEIAAADAAVITAGGRPQPELAGDLEYAFSNPQADSRWGVAVSTIFTLELGGKPGARIGRARAAALATRAAAREDEWRLAGEVYRAALAMAQRTHEAATLARERRLQDSIVLLARARYEQATATRSELARLESEAHVALAEEQQARRDADAARAALGSSVGLPGAGPDLPFAEQPWPSCQQATADREALQRAALLRRWSVRRAAADYQVAEGDLRIEVAAATPDLSLGPGLFFDQGSGKFTLGFGLPALLLNRNRGPIAEAEARRKLAAARLEQAQESVLTELDQALGACRRLAEDAATYDSLEAGAAERVELAEAAWRRGEVGRLDVLLARLEQLRASRLRQALLARQWEARLALDLATGAWGLEDDGPWPGGERNP